MMKILERKVSNLTHLNNKEKAAVIADLEQTMAEKVKNIDIEGLFYRTQDEALILNGEEKKKGKAKEYRIDVNKANDTGKDMSSGEHYYLQLQNGSETYANVLYPHGATKQDFVDAIIYCLTNQKGALLTP